MPAMRIGYLVMPQHTLAQFGELGEILETGLRCCRRRSSRSSSAKGTFIATSKDAHPVSAAPPHDAGGHRSQLSGAVYLELTDGGMHIVAFLRRGTQDVALATLWAQQALHVRPLSGWYAQTQSAMVGDWLPIFSRLNRRGRCWRAWRMRRGRCWLYSGSVEKRARDSPRRLA